MAANGNDIPESSKPRVQQTNLFIYIAIIDCLDNILRYMFAVIRITEDGLTYPCRVDRRICFQG